MGHDSTDSKRGQWENKYLAKFDWANWLPRTNKRGPEPEAFTVPDDSDAEGSTDEDLDIKGFMLEYDSEDDDGNAPLRSKRRLSSVSSDNVPLAAARHKRARTVGPGNDFSRRM